LIEADFQREYQIDLNLSLASLTWRRFVVLLGGLSGESRWQGALQNGKKKPREVSGKAAESYALSLKTA